MTALSGRVMWGFVVLPTVCFSTNSVEALGAVLRCTQRAHLFKKPRFCRKSNGCAVAFAQLASSSIILLVLPDRLLWLLFPACQAIITLTRAQNFTVIVDWWGCARDEQRSAIMRGCKRADYRRALVRDAALPRQVMEQRALRTRAYFDRQIARDALFRPLIR